MSFADGRDTTASMGALAALLARLDVPLAVVCLEDSDDIAAGEVVYASSMPDWLQPGELLGDAVPEHFRDVLFGAIRDALADEQAHTATPAPPAISPDVSEREPPEPTDRAGHPADASGPSQVTAPIVIHPLGGHHIGLSCRSATERDQVRTIEFLDAIIDNIPSVIFVKGARELRFERMNRAAEQLFGTRRDRFYGKNDHDFFPREQADFFTLKDREVLAGNAVLDIPEEPIETPDGLRWLHTRKVPLLDENGMPTHLLGISEDITARKKTEEELAWRTDELRRSNAELEQFASVVTHDLHEPLRAIHGYLTHLTEDHAGDLDEVARRYIDRATAGAHRMQELLSGLLRYARLESGAMTLMPVRLDEVMTSVVSNLDVALRETGSEVKYGGLPTLRGSHTQMIQLFQNLVANSIKFRKDEPPVIIVTASHQDREWVIEINDNGIGMDMAHADGVFQIFRRLDHDSQGTGLGLAIAEKIVVRHGGRIWLESEPGAGTTVFIAMPDFRPRKVPPATRGPR